MRPEAIIISDNPDADYKPGFNLTLSPPEWQGYSHEKRDVGWFWQASFNLVRPDEELEEFFETGMNRAIEVYSRRGRSIWEGWINEMTLRRGGVELRRGFGKTANRVWGRFSDPTGSGKKSDVVEDARSIELYGIKEKPIGLGQVLGSSQALRIATTYLNTVRFPENPSVTVTGGRQSSRRTTLEIRCSGWWHKLYWRVFNDPDAPASRTLTAQVQRVFSVVEWPVAGEYEYNGSSTPAPADADMWAADVLLNCAKQGDANYDRWIVGIGPGRVPYYRRAVATRLPEVVE